MQWDTPAVCGKGQSCSRGRCRKKKRGTKPPPKAEPAAFIHGKIISMYTKDGRRTLHIEVGENSGVRAGMAGIVLKGKGTIMVPNGTCSRIISGGAIGPDSFSGNSLDNFRANNPKS